MAGKGRHKVPDGIRRLTGERDQTGSRGDSPEFDLGGKAPGWLSDYAREEWDVVAEQLDRLGMLCKPSVATLAAYCENVSVMRASVESIKELGIMLDGKKNPAVTAFDSASKAVRMFASEFGFTPASAAKLQVGDSDKDELGSFLGEPTLKVHGTAGNTG